MGLNYICGYRWKSRKIENIAVIVPPESKVQLHHDVWLPINIISDVETVQSNLAMIS